MNPRLEVRGVTKRFPGVLANDRVDFAVMPGEIHALLGENGAGKSTLVKMIYGVLRPDSGDIQWNGEPVVIADPSTARRLGIGMVFQHFSLFEAMTVNENIALGMDRPGDMAALALRVKKISADYGLPLDPDRGVYSLSVGERQRIEITRCLLQDPKLLIMDEPTSVLTPQEVERLFETLRQIASEGCSILYISHKLAEIKALCDRATILRAGAVVAECDPGTETAASMAQIMIGEELTSVERRAGDTAGEARMVVEGLELASEDLHGVDLQGINFTVRAGEILGIAGVAGNGQGELLQALSGERLIARPESIKVDGQVVGHLSAGARRGHGVCAIPEERNGHGAVAALNLVENAVLSAHHRMNLLTAGFIKRAEAKAFTEAVVAQYDVRTPSVTTPAGSLSGGNLQKFIVGREIMQNPVVLIASQPTWGVDAGAAARIHQALIDLAAAGTAVVVISQDLDELMAISNRLAVLNLGVLSKPIDTARVSVEEIGLLMGGVHGDSETPGAVDAA
jgi:simple sugar transport system ATP-binding protein